MNNPLKIGITGGIGSGKSIIAKVFKLLGIQVYSADNRAKWLISNDPDLKKAIIKNFGQEAYFPDGTLNRGFLANTVFSDPEKVKIINSLVHPAVGKDFENWVKDQGGQYVLKEAALIFETGGEKKLDGVINVSAPLKIRINRVLSRDSHRTLDQVNKIIDQQLPDKQKCDKADWVIRNSPNRLVLPQILEIHQELSGRKN
ncbi:dephospho-CoA kinase [Algoriphagus sediminis]|uniref:Dephospho-CoA kinase n=1 Tax=Algoriphagus sediminis TaxID=3057113 RepID=A0ABT7YED6_9BACT|nr:dephospho-CoA kinase [Algoriphagus sediminis]MDN3204879.1 dephospho-CoA kinase [Algoriphagus sediminis]